MTSENKHPEESKPEMDESKPAESPEKPEKKSTKEGQNKLQQLWGWALANKKLSIPASLVLLLVILFALPFTRYALAGVVIKKDITVVVLDSQTSKPVTSAQVTFKGLTAKTDNQGKAKLHVAVGSGQLVAAKLYYENVTQGITVPLGSHSSYQLRMLAKGRPVPITVINKISGQPVENASIAAANTQAKTDKKGKTTIVLPADRDEVEATFAASGFNSVTAKLKITADDDPANKVSMTPAGKLYFLSNASGKLDVIKSNLDGTDRKVVLAGTGKEDRYNTVLLASRDWKYIALYSKRDGGDNAKLFLIDTSNGDKLTTMDEGDASFEPKGWSGDRFIYVVNRNKVESYQPKRQALKSYQASTGKIAVLDETDGFGNTYDPAYEVFNSVFVLDNVIAYNKNWSWYTGHNLVNGKQDTFNSVKPDGTQKKVVKGYNLDFNKYFYLEGKPGEFGEIYIRYASGDEKPGFDEYSDGKIAPSKIDDNDFYNKLYPTYVVSPTDQKTLWSDFRDGKNIMFVGNATGQNGKQVGSSEDYSTYGWFTDDYILVTKKGSEMHIMPANGLRGGLDASLKVSDYYKPNYYIPGYGYGYGG